MSPEDNVEKLRPLLYIEEIVTFAQNLLADKLMGPKEKRVGVFGPYGPMDEVAISDVMKMISKKGSTAFSGIGYLKPDDPNIHSIEPFRPPFIDYVFRKLLPPTRYWHVFPRIGSKAVVNLYPARTNIIELEGCIEYRIPMLGFIRRDVIYKENPIENCDYLKFNENYSECVAPEISFCRFIRFCPFTSPPIVLPETIREVFINNPENRLVAIREIEDLEVPLSEFLS